MSMPAQEFLRWREFFSIYPFTQDREDGRIALLCSAIYNAAGKRFKQTIKPHSFIPKYYDPERKAVLYAPKSLDDQRNEFRAFVQKVQSLQGRKPV